MTHYYKIEFFRFIALPPVYNLASVLNTLEKILVKEIVLCCSCSSRAIQMFRKRITKLVLGPAGKKMTDIHTNMYVD